MRINTYEEIVNSIREKPFVVYGAGGHADKFLKAVREMGFDNNYLYSVVSKKKEEGDYLIQDVDRNQVIMVAAHDRNSFEMERTLKDLGFENYYLIYPHLIELGCGLPYKKNMPIDVLSFLKGCLYGNYLSIIYLAIDDIMNHNGVGRDLYLKYMRIYSTSDTANKRLESLTTRSYHISSTHDVEPYNIKVNPTEHFILDGSHRAVLAKYFGIETVMADLYDVSFEHYNFFFWGGVYLSDEVLQSFFSPADCELIISTRLKVFE